MAEGEPPPFQIFQFEPTYEAFGMITDFLAQYSPFADFELGPYSRSIQMQLRQKRNLGALRGGVLVGYAGWLMTTPVIAQAWINGTGKLKPARGPDAEAAVLTTVAVSDPGCTPLLIRRARELNPGRRAYFKRGAEATGVRKNSVLIFSESED